MIPFERTWPYETVGGDLYVSECPFCDNRNILLPIKPRELEWIRGGRKRLLVFPCCNGRVTIVDADGDYLLAAKPLRRR